MTLKEIECMDEDFLTVQQVARCMHMSEQLIRDQCERDVKWLGFPICRAGHAFRIPREGFLSWANGRTPVAVYDNSVQFNKATKAGYPEKEGTYEKQR